MTARVTGHLFLLKDRELNGHLTEKLEEWRREGKSERDIARLLSFDGAKVSRGSIQQWLKELNIRKGRRNGKIRSGKRPRA